MTFRLETDKKEGKLAYISGECQFRKHLLSVSNEQLWVCSLTLSSIVTYRAIFSATSTSTTTTTTASTTTSEEPQVCQHPGLNPDPTIPRDCSIYFACKPAPNYPDHWLITQCNCPDGLAFDPDLEVCTWPSTLDDCKSLMKATFEVGLRDHEDCTARIKRL